MTYQIDDHPDFCAAHFGTMCTCGLDTNRETKKETKMIHQQIVDQLKARREELRAQIRQSVNDPASKIIISQINMITVTLSKIERLDAFNREVDQHIEDCKTWILR